MKTFRLPLIMALTLFITSCGKDKENKVATPSDPASPTTTLNNSGNFNSAAYQSPNLTSQTVNFINSVRSKTRCPQGYDQGATYTGKRLAQYISFHTGVRESDRNNTTLDHQGPLTAGRIASRGNREEVYAGKSIYGDLLFVVKHMNDTQVTGYSYIASMCEAQVRVQDPFTYQPVNLPMVGDQNQVMAFENVSPTVINAQSCQAMGMVDRLLTKMYVRPQNAHAGYGNLTNGNLQIQTSFFPLQECYPYN